MTILRDLNEAIGQVTYIPYNMKEIFVSYGMPPVPLTGIDFISAAFVKPRVKSIPSLTGPGVFAKNKNQEGFIEIGILSSSLSSGAIQLLDYTGINFPVIAADGTTRGTSFIAGTKCRLIQTPEWRRDRVVGVTVFTFLTTRLIISHGLRAMEIEFRRA